MKHRSGRRRLLVWLSSALSLLMLFGCSSGQGQIVEGRRNLPEDGGISPECPVAPSMSDSRTQAKPENGGSSQVEPANVSASQAYPNNGGSSQAEPATGVAPFAEPTSAPVPFNLPKPDTNYVTEEMLDNAILNEGNLARLAAVMRKARNGEAITVGVIGGSITQGSLASNPQNTYAYHFQQWWVEAFPNAKINLVNAGIGATTSYLGVHRVDKDLLSKKPDVVVVEFSVNDTDSPFYKQTYEDFLRKILKADHMPAVILLFMTMEDGTSAQPSHLHVGFWYDLPRLSYRDMIQKELKKGTFAWTDISPDDIHPNDKGHAMAGEILWSYLNSVYAKLDTVAEDPRPLEKEPIYNEAYDNAVILDNKSITPASTGSFEAGSPFECYPNGWTTRTGEEGIVFEVEARNIGIIFHKTTDGQSGQYEVYIDGALKRTLNADFKGGWGNYAETVEVFRSDVKEKHTIEIMKSPNSTGDVFSILGLLIS